MICVTLHIFWCMCHILNQMNQNKMFLKCTICLYDGLSKGRPKIHGLLWQFQQRFILASSQDKQKPLCIAVLCSRWMCCRQKNMGIALLQTVRVFKNCCLASLTLSSQLLCTVSCLSPQAPKSNKPQGIIIIGVTEAGHGQVWVLLEDGDTLQITEELWESFKKESRMMGWQSLSL